MAASRPSSRLRIPIERTVTTFDEEGTPVAWTSMPQGNVADRESPHFDDLHDDWVEGRYQRLLYDRDEIEAGAERRETLRR